MHCCRLTSYLSFICTVYNFIWITLLSDWCYTGNSDCSLPFLLLSSFEDVFMSLLFDQQSMQLQIFGLLVCLADLFSVRFTTCGFSSSLKKCYYLKWPISNWSGFNCLDTQGSVLATVVFWTCSEKNGYHLCTDVSRRGRNFTACFSLIAMDVSRFMVTFLELLPSWEEFPFQTITMRDHYKDAALPYLLGLVVCLKYVVSLENSWAKRAAIGFSRVFHIGICDNISLF